jgi:subtilisin family serine protease
VGESGHGTHVSGIIAADRPGDGVVGVSPGVRIAAVRLLGRAGQYYGENMVCGFLWAADHGARVINDSYFSDPWKYNCPQDPDQVAIIAAVGRAVAYAQQRGAVVVASAGNDAQDLGAPRTDDRSPNDRADGAPQPDRHLGAECIRLPGGLPGVVDVTAVDADGSLAGYSNWGAGRVQLAAPGGDPDGGPDQSVVSDWPGGGYAALAGTSMAAAHVSGAAAVEAALHPQAGSAELVRLLERTALPVQCPSGNVGGSGCPGAAYYGYGLVELPTR